jgi:hypothetical protein
MLHVVARKKLRTGIKLDATRANYNLHYSSTRRGPSPASTSVITGEEKVVGWPLSRETRKKREGARAVGNFSIEAI